MNSTTLVKPEAKGGFPAWLKTVLGIVVFAILLTVIAMGTGVFDSRMAELSLPDPANLPPDARARQAFRAGDWPMLEGAYRQMLMADQFDSNAMFYLAFSLHKQKKYDEAIPFYEKATEFYRYGPVSFYNLACISALQNRPDEAIAHLDQSISKGYVSSDGIEQNEDFQILLDDPEFHRLIMMEVENRDNQHRRQKRR